MVAEAVRVAVEAYRVAVDTKAEIACERVASVVDVDSEVQLRQTSRG